MSNASTNLSVLAGGQTTGGAYFVSNYPPFSFWRRENVGDVLSVLDSAPDSDNPLGIYAHIPFCRKRCHFCYFKVYTDRNAAQIREYIDAMISELTLYAAQPFIAGRKPKFVYFGGGTPSYLSAEQLRDLTDRMKAILPWDEAEEVTFECEPGTLNEKKLQAIRDMGVTRLSLGVEHFDEDILKNNGRAHGAKEIPRAYEFARSVAFDQINIDLIAGMVGETDATWDDAVAKAIALEPDSVTIYQMEIPFNTTIYHDMKDKGKAIAPVADWETKRNWLDRAFDAFVAAGYEVSSAYTVVKSREKTRFVYRDALWTGADMVPVGVSSFGKLGPTHVQSEKDIPPYLEALSENRLPLRRALTMTQEERFIREFILQMKLGRVDVRYFKSKFGQDVTQRFAAQFEELKEIGWVSGMNGDIQLSRQGLLRVDAFLPAFFLPQHRDQG